MSPEQVRGQETDSRSDIFSFGVILYEMLSGRRTFAGESAVEVMNAILKEEPPELSETNAKISPALDRIVRRCLEKKPEHRFHSAHDLGFALEALSLSGSSGAKRMEAAQSVETAILTKRGGWRERVGWIVAGVLALALLALGVAYFRRPAPEAEPSRLFVTPPEKATSFDLPGISPDGRTLAFVATVAGKTHLWVRPLNSTNAKPLAEVEMTGRFSPDGQWIAYSSNASGRLEIYLQAFVPDAPASGGEWQLSTNGGTGPKWRRDGRELYYISLDNKLMAVEVALGAEVKWGTPKELFSLNSIQADATNGYTKTGDGQRFLFMTIAEETSLTPFTVVQNWMAEMKK
jgi:hypothetical protein